MGFGVIYLVYSVPIESVLGLVWVGREISSPPASLVLDAEDRAMTNTDQQLCPYVVMGARRDYMKDGL